MKKSLLAAMLFLATVFVFADEAVSINEFLRQNLNSTYLREVVPTGPGLFRVEFMKEAKLCSVNLKVTGETVKQKAAPLCR